MRLFLSSSFLFTLRPQPRSTLFPTRRSSDLLSPEDYGVIQLVEMTLDFVAILAGAKLAIGEDCHEVERHFEDRKSTRLNSSHLGISYAVFCLKKKIRSRNSEGSPGTGPVSNS